MELDIKPFQARLERLAFNNHIEIVQFAEIDEKLYKVAMVLAQSFNEHMLVNFTEEKFNYHLDLIKTHLENIAYRIFHILKMEGYNSEILPPLYLTDKNKDCQLNKEMAKLAGIGKTGKKGFFVHPTHGVKIVICSILTDAPLEVDKEFKIDLCKNCSICDENNFFEAVKKCPYGKDRATWNLFKK